MVVVVVVVVVMCVSVCVCVCDTDFTQELDSKLGHHEGRNQDKEHHQADSPTEGGHPHVGPESELCRCTSKVWNETQLTDT